MRRPDYYICPQELLAVGALLLKQLHQYSYALGDLCGDPSGQNIIQSVSGPNIYENSQWIP